MKTVAPNPALLRSARAALTRAAAGAIALMTLTAAAAVICGCAAAGSSSARYPRRPPGCALSVYHTAVPGVAAWDDLGVAEAVCNIGVPVAECLRLLRAEACRMGGDILYNVPRQPFRPRDQVLQFRGQVAHTRQAGADHAEAPHDDGDESRPAKEGGLPPPASAEESAGPITPLPSAHAPGAPEPPPGKDSTP